MRNGAEQCGRKENKGSAEKAVVSLARWESLSSVAEAIEQCAGFVGLKPGARVLLKPNLVGWDTQGPYPPWGVLTTSVVVEGVCAALWEAGAGEIIIGESSVECRALGSSTSAIFQRLGYEKLASRYGARVVDFNADHYEEVELEPGHVVEVTRWVQEVDFFINLPVLKTHNTTIVSLGMKNLKGLLSHRSKHYCHHPDNLLSHFITLLAEHFPPHLTLIDGIYALEQGPLHFGRAHPRSVLLASRDIYAADLAGAYLLGFTGTEISHLREWAERHQRSFAVEDLECRGLSLTAERKPLKWDWEWLPDNSAPNAFVKQGLAGVLLPKYDHTLCTGCSYMFNPLMLALLSCAPGHFPTMEILSGSIMEPSGRAEKTFLFGTCQIRKHRRSGRGRNLIPMKGCPPSLATIVRVLNEHGLPATRVVFDQYRAHLMRRYATQADLFPAEHFYLRPTPVEVHSFQKREKPDEERKG